MAVSETALYLSNPELAQAMRRQRMAEMFMRGNQQEDIRHPLQGLSNVAGKLLGAYLMRGSMDAGERAQEKADKEREEFRAMVGQAFGGGAGMPMPAGQPVQAPQPAAPAQAPQAPQAGASPIPPGLHMAESGGSMAPGIYGDGGRAAGPLQVHAAALSDVNARLGTNYTHEQLAAQPEIGKRVGEEYYRMMLEQNGGDPQKAAAAYNAGPGRVAAAVRANPQDWMAGLPESTRAYVQRVVGSGGAPPIMAPAQAQAMPGGGTEADMDRARQLQMLAMQAANSSNPQIRSQASVLAALGSQAENRALQQQARADARANRTPSTVQLEDPDRQTVGVYEQLPGGGIGRRLGTAQTRADPIQGRQFDQANTLRDEFGRLTADFRTVQSAYENIRSSAASQSGAGDMSMLYSYVKLLDPTSVVRESEFAMAAASGSYGERIQGAVQRVLSGERLPESLRRDFLSEARNIYNNQARSHDTIAETYERLAKRLGVDPEVVVTRFKRDQTPREEIAPAPGEASEWRPSVPGERPAETKPRGIIPPPPQFRIVQ